MFWMSDIIFPVYAIPFDNIIVFNFYAITNLFIYEFTNLKKDCHSFFYEKKKGGTRMKFEFENVLNVPTEQ